MGSHFGSRGRGPAHKAAMPLSFGKRARTRDKFSKAFKTKGLPALARYLTTYKRGDLVDIKADPSIQVGMPYNFYHGKTGVVFNVTKTAVGVEVTKVVGNRQLRKRLHVRVEHVAEGPKPGKIVKPKPGTVCVMEAQPFNENYF